ncbi:MAG: CHRD domain-containing protein [Fimbriimonadia bacterium]|nr:CHRD domain-containing protein [Fimbriimonadia bacterium]
MFKSSTLFASMAMFVALSVSASAQMWSFHETLSGSQEVPANGSQTTGMAMGTYNQATKVLHIEVTSTTFTSNIRAGHIHHAAVGVNGPVIFPLTHTGGARDWVSDNTFVLSDAQEALLLSGNYYVNLHTDNFPGGEIRTQLNPVPEPASLIALGAGLIGVAIRRRKR